MKLYSKYKKKKELYFFYFCTILALMFSRSTTLKLEKLSQNNSVKINNLTLIRNDSHNSTSHNNFIEHIQFFDRKNDISDEYKTSSGYRINENNEIVINANILNNEELNLIKK